jgi:hypothetical protein
LGKWQRENSFYTPLHYMCTKRSRTSFTPASIFGWLYLAGFKLTVHSQVAQAGDQQREQDRTHHHVFFFYLGSAATQSK